MFKLVSSTSEGAVLKKLRDIKADWLIAGMPSKVRLLKKHPRISNPSERNTSKPVSEQK